MKCSCIRVLYAAFLVFVLCRNVETLECNRVSYKAYIPSTADRDKAEPSKVDNDKYSSTSVLSKYAILLLLSKYAILVLFLCCFVQ